MTYFKPCDHCGKQHAKMLRCPNLKVEDGVTLVGTMPLLPSTTNLVSTKDVSRLTSTTYTGRDAEQRKKQQAALMRKRRAAAKAKAKK